jgi:hypothetical protein
MTPERDLEIRTALSKALGAPIQYESEYGYSSRKTKQTVYTWDEILIEVGKVIERGTGIINVDKPIE